MHACVYRGLPAGIYATNNSEACHFVADNCKANIIVVENKRQLDKILEVSTGIIEVYYQWVELCVQTGICDPLSENPALPANIEFELDVILSVQVVFQLS